MNGRMIERLRSARLWTAAALAFTMAAAFAIRVVPPYHIVFTPLGVDFQEFDAWYHMRTVHNMMAHFPHRTGFDPYALFPGGQDIVTAPFWDWMIGWTAWLLGTGSPSAVLVDRVGALLPAVLGALFPLPVFWLAQTLFGRAAGLFAAWWVAWIPGGLLWLTHLGLADHHAAESFFALLTVACVVQATATVSRSPWLTVAAGCSLGALLATRPAGAFLVLVLVLAAFLHPDRRLASVSLASTAIGALLFLPVTGKWSDFAWLALGGGILALAGLLTLEALWRRLAWPRVTLPAALLALAAVLAAGIYFARPTLVYRVVFMAARMLGYTSEGNLRLTVDELKPLLQSGPSPWGALNFQYGTSWILAPPALIGIVLVGRTPWSARDPLVAQVPSPRWRPALTVFVLWSLVTLAGSLIQLRMVVYGAVSAAILCGLACAWVTRVPNVALRVALTAAAAGLIVVSNLPTGFFQMGTDLSPSLDWRMALVWLRERTPEPMGDSTVYLRAFPPRYGAPFPYPPSAYSVVTTWDHGYWVMNLARRMPSANGTQQGAGVTARFFSDTVPSDAEITLRELGARYVIADPQLLAKGLTGQSEFPGILIWSGRPISQFIRVLFAEDGGERNIVLVYMPDYYRSMAVRLARFDGRRTASHESWVFSTRQDPQPDGTMIDLVSSPKQFPSESAARAYMAEHPGESLLLGGLDGSKTCVDLEESSGLRQVFTSREDHAEHAERAVKIFEAVR
jgi:asparagine N-glycosylation enzyme membrane subunit Stt3